jgi:hypothetical protein
MSDETLTKLLKKVDEHFAHKEHVSSQVLMDLMKKMELLQTDIHHIKAEIQEISITIDKSVTSLKNEMDMRHLAIGNDINESKKNDAKVDKILNWVAGLVGTALILALLGLIMKP